jgi:hypothetical protein
VTCADPAYNKDTYEEQIEGVLNDVGSTSVPPKQRALEN